MAYQHLTQHVCCCIRQSEMNGQRSKHHSPYCYRYPNHATAIEMGVSETNAREHLSQPLAAMLLMVATAVVMLGHHCYISRCEIVIFHSIRILCPLHPSGVGRFLFRDAKLLLIFRHRNHYLSGNLIV